ncbi:MAG: SufD family Fe-S cluster assembly protein [Coriobacteriaceae bacterium]|nr:SufD family Fe-S cluster assembly protein [Coriobacteriaceae bacterium]
MPAPTWSWLKMNSVDIEVPEGLERTCRVEIEASEALTDNMKSFEGALAELQGRQNEARAADSAATDDRAVARAARGADQGAADLDTPALSAYERSAVLSELAGDVARDFETGVGTNARSYLNFLAGGTVVLAAKEGAVEEAAIRVTANAGETSGASIDVVCAPDSELKLTLSLDSDAADPAFVGSTLRIFAGARARVDIVVYVTGSDAVTAVEDSGFVLDEGARVSVRHVVLGGKFTATGLAADLRGDHARIDVDTSYLAGGTEQRDFNYVIRHRGRKTVSNMDANGVLTGTSKKCLRGTIDLIHGAKGAEGNERETVLLASKGVDNKTIPSILCDEDDVAGNHGATIGHVRPEQLFYAACRGLSQEQTEALFLSAKLEEAVLTAPTDEIRTNVVRLGNQIVPNFEEEIA